MVDKRVDVAMELYNMSDDSASCLPLPCAASLIRIASMDNISTAAAAAATASPSRPDEVPLSAPASPTSPTLARSRLACRWLSGITARSGGDSPSMLDLAQLCDNLSSGKGIDGESSHQLSPTSVTASYPWHS